MTTQPKTNEQQKKWLVVGPVGQVLRFETEAKAKQFLDAEAEVCAPDIEAEARMEFKQRMTAEGIGIKDFPGVSAESVIADRAKKGRERQRAGLLDDPALQPVLNRDRGFSGPLEVASVNQFRGKVFNGRGIDDYLRGYTFHAPGPLRLSEQRFAHGENIVEITEDDQGAPEQTGVLRRELERELEPVLSSYLDDDWRFLEMAEYAVRCPGHNFVDRQTGTADLAVVLLGDLQATLRRFWPNLPVGAVASFWRSWQVHNYIVEFFAEFARSTQAKKLQQALPPEDRCSVEQLAEGSMSFARRQVAQYVHVLTESLDGVADSNGAESKTEVAPVVALSARVVQPITASRWQDITLTFVSEKSVLIQVQGGLSEPRNYTEMGFSDQRSGNPTIAWLILVTLSGPQGHHDLRRVKSDHLTKRVQEIRAGLKRVFRIESDPLPFKHEGEARYQPAFKLNRSSSFGF